MKRLIKRILSIVIALVAAFCGVRFGPSLCIRFFGEGNTQWISQQLSESLREKNELIVYEVETSGIETVSQNAWLIGTVQKVELPYQFSMSFTVDLSLAEVEILDGEIEVRLPYPKASYPKLVVDKDGMKKTDWLYPLTPERYAEIVTEMEKRFYANASENVDYLNAAWDVAVNNMNNLFSTIASQSVLGQTCDIMVVPLQ